MDQLPIIDAHHHLWDLEHGRYPWLQGPMAKRSFGDFSKIRRSYRIEDYLADTKNQNVVKSVHLQAEYDHTDPVAETRWLQGVADAHGFPHAIVAFADLAAPGLGALLEQHCRYRNVRGIRQLLNWHPDPLKTFTASPDIIASAAWQGGYRLLREFGLSFDLQIYYGQMEEGYQLAKRFPETQIILNHTGMPADRTPEDVAGWRRGMKRLAEAPNVACKISGLGMVDLTWTVDSIRPFVLDAIEAFGVDRCAFASNFPVDSLFSSYDAIFDAFKAITRDFPAGDRAKLFHDNAARLYRI
jgi:predicted TIM-barrel fold metal-dependent hydrolase